MNKKVIALNMSILDKRFIKYSCYKKDNQIDDEDYYYWGVSQLEAGTKMILMDLANEGVKVDTIIVTATPEANNKFPDSEEHIKDNYKIFLGNEKLADSAVDFYKKRIKDFIFGEEDNSKFEPSGKDIVKYNDESVLSDSQKRCYESLKNLYKDEDKNSFMDEIIKIVELKDEISTEFMDIVEYMNASESEKVDLYIDFQGGKRNFVYIMNATLDMLPGLINVKGRYSIDFNKENAVQPIVSEESMHKVMELAAAVKSFNQYGRADMLEAYFSNNQNSVEAKMIEILKGISDTLSICNPDGFYSELDKLREFYADGNDKKCTDPQFRVVVNEIRKQYGPLLAPERTVLESIEWSLDHDFIQQALTLIESLIPEELMDKGIITYKKEQEVPVKYRNKGREWLTSNEIIKVEDAINKSKESNNKAWEKSINYVFLKWINFNTERDKNKIDLTMNFEDYFSIPVPKNLNKLKGMRKPHIQYKDDNKVPYSIDLEINLKEAIKNNFSNSELFNRFIQLFSVLKAQRNTANHAVTTERYSAENIKTAIRAFIDMAKKIYAM